MVVIIKKERGANAIRLLVCGQYSWKRSQLMVPPKGLSLNNKALWLKAGVHSSLNKHDCRVVIALITTTIRKQAGRGRLPCAFLVAIGVRLYSAGRIACC